MANRPRPIFSFISMIIIFITFSISVNSQVSFNIDSFTPGDSRITLQDTASINNGVLALINPQTPLYNRGRALYSKTVPLWSTSGVASFVTSFSFTVRNVPGCNVADGFIFFLSPTSAIPSNSNAGLLGVVNSNDHFNRFVGVEFDSYPNPWDPRYQHIGIDVNSLDSLQTVRWNRTSGSLVRVNVIYDGPSKTLSVLVTQDGKISTVSQVVDLQAVLPQNVYIGLSATTGTDATELINVHSWSFSSTSPSPTNNLLGIIAEQI